jgi:hypothetical protein
MADLAEIMAAKGDPMPESAPQTQTRREPTAIVEQTTRPDRNPVQPQGQEPQTAQPDPNAPPQDETDPVSGLRKALDEERGKRRGYKDELAKNSRELAELRGMIAALSQGQQRQQQPQAPQPEPTTDDELNEILSKPGAFIDTRLQRSIQQAMTPVQQTLDRFNRFEATQQHTKEVVDEAEKTFMAALQAGQVDPTVVQRIVASPNRYDAAVAWFRSTNPASERDRMRAELLAELKAEQEQAQTAAPQQQQAPQGAPLQSMPTSFAQARSSGPRTAPGWTGPKPLSELMPR